jgi:DNA (cytosine-5)-methyltransferase 1
MKWPRGSVTAVEINPDIAKFYSQQYPEDTVIIADAHQYLLDHYPEFDFIWASPPCPTHSDIRRMAVHHGSYLAVYPDMSLYQEIILLQNFAPIGARWVVENVKPYYPPLIPGKLLHRHLFWSNFPIPYAEIDDDRIPHNDIKASSEVYGIKLPEYIKDGKKVLRNMVNPDLALHIYNTAAGIKNIKTIQIGMYL